MWILSRLRIRNRRTGHARHLGFEALETRALLTTIDLGSLGAAGVSIFGADVDDRSGYAVDIVRDVNGDDFDDLLIGARFADSVDNGRQDAGESYLIYGGPALPGSIDLANLGAAGVVLYGIDAGDRVGISVSSGDVNGDGYGDLLIGATGADGPSNTRFGSGESYVIYGGPMLPNEIDLTDLGQAGVTIFGSASGDFSGRPLRNAGDVNADGYEDLLIPASEVSGTSLVFGGPNLPVTIDLANLAGAGVRITGASGYGVGGAGDVNGDGFDDVAIGAPEVDGENGDVDRTGAAYLIYGGSDLPPTIDVAAADVAIFGELRQDNAGETVSSAGDVNNDGFGDVLIGAPTTQDITGIDKSYIVFGGPNLPSVIPLSSLGNAGVKLVQGRSLGDSLAAAGDVNGDGIDDFIIGAPQNSGLGSRSLAGESLVVFGATDLPDTLDVRNLGAAGLTIAGADEDDFSGMAVGAGGDVNGDGFDDVIVGAREADGDGNNKRSAGESYLLFGGDFSSVVTHRGSEFGGPLFGTSSSDVMIGNRSIDELFGLGGADVLRGGASTDAIHVADLDFARVVGGNGDDALVLDGANLTLDLTALPDNHIEGIERIALPSIDQGPDTLILDVQQVLNISRESNTLTVSGAEEDIVEIGAGWSFEGVVDTLGSRFDVFRQGAAVLQVELAMQVYAEGSPFLGGSSLSGQVREDLNNPGFGEDAVPEPPMQGVTVYLDVVQNGQFDPGEPSVETFADGTYRFDYLQPGSYVVRQVVPDQYRQTVPDPGLGNSLFAERVAAGLNNPVYITHPPGDAERLFIVEKGGAIKILDLTTGALNAQPFLNVPDTDAAGEGGLLGMAFHPDFANNGRFYVYVTVDNGGLPIDGVVSPFSSHVREYTVSAGNPDLADPGSQREIIQWVQPRTNHNGGWLGFGPNDGFLYITSGDGGGSGDPGNHAQNTADLLGKILRIDVDGDDFPAGPDRNYAVPASNPLPLAGLPGADEIWSYGLRNPWRAAFDRHTGDLWIGDVGQNAREEIDFQSAASLGGENYGWDRREGTIAYQSGASQPGDVEPVYDYAHGGGDFQGNSVVGGYVYRGPVEQLQGLYVFADTISGNLWSFAPANPSATVQKLNAVISPDVGTIGFPVSFGEDASGHLYVVDFSATSGEIFRFALDQPDAYAVTLSAGEAITDLDFGNHMITIESVHQFVVNSTLDTGDENIGDGVCDDGLGNCTLRAALQEANAVANASLGPDQILFDIAGTAPHTIRPQGVLPNITDPVIIDAATQPGYAGMPLVELDGSSTRPGANGLTVSGAGAGSTIRGLAINRFDANGIFVSRRDNVLIEGNSLGTDPSGRIDLGNGQAGVSIVNGQNNTIHRNLISGNDLGILVEGPLSTGNAIAANFIGTDIDGRQALRNRGAGVDIAGAPNNTVGGPTASGRNVISGNKYGVSLRGSAATGNVVAGNFIGTTATGDDTIRNVRGIYVQDAAANTIGGAGEAGNVISGNAQGVYILRGENNRVQGNKIGTDAMGNKSVPNTRGLLVRDGVNNDIGGEPNVISGNEREGVKIFGEASTGNVLKGNLIGTSAAVDKPVANRIGVLITGSASGNFVGSAADAMGNVISGNAVAGVQLSAGGNFVEGNLIGLDATGGVAMANEIGVWITRGAGNRVGGAIGAARNVISGNLEYGIAITGPLSTANHVWGNLIGTDGTGMTDVANFHGVYIASPGNTIGGASPGRGNVISGNTKNGVLLEGAAATGNTIAGNRIGPNVDGSASVRNGANGIDLENAPRNLIGGTSPAAGNSIAGNILKGVKISGPLASANVLQGNSIGIDAETGGTFHNDDGVFISQGASNNVIGGTADGAVSEIAENIGRGIWISGGTGNRVSRNSIHDNGQLGLDLANRGRNANDDDDPDDGANRIQNFPDIASATLAGGNLEIRYSVPSLPANSAFPLSVEFYFADAAGQEGQHFLATDDYLAPGVKLFSVPAGVTEIGFEIVATATDADGNTSEFSNPVIIDELQSIAATAADAAFGDIGK